MIVIQVVSNSRCMVRAWMVSMFWVETLEFSDYDLGLGG